MSISCPKNDEWLAFVGETLDGDRKADMRAHLGSCATCQQSLEEWQLLAKGIAAPLPGLDSDRVGEQLLAKLRAQPDARAPISWWRASLALGSLLAATAIVLLLILGERGPSPEKAQSFQARGGSSRTELARKVGAHFLVVRKGALVALSQDAIVSASEGLTLSYVNAIHPKKVYLLAFVLDSQREIHWLFPAYLRSSDNPLALELVASKDEIVLPDAVVPDAPAKGASTLVWMASFEQPTVASIESLPKAERTLASLQARWPKAELGHLRIQIHD